MEARTVPPLVTSPVLVVGRIVVPAQRLLVLGVAVVVAAGLAVFLRRSLLGLAVRAAAGRTAEGTGAGSLGGGLRSIVAGIDDTPGTSRALQRAVELARGSSGMLHLVGAHGGQASLGLVAAFGFVDLAFEMKGAVEAGAGRAEGAAAPNWGAGAGSCRGQ